MPQLKATLLLEIDGQEVPFGPLIRRLVVTEALAETIQKSADNNSTTFSQFPASLPATLQAFLASPDSATNYKFNNGGAISLNVGGILFIFGATINSGVTTNATINNPAASQAANIQAVVGGS